MNRAADLTVDANQRCLVADLAWLQRHLRFALPPDDAVGTTATDPRKSARDGDGPPDRCAFSRLDRLCELFGLSTFERTILLLAAGIELDGSFARLCAQLHGDERRGFVTFGLALAHLPEAHWSALAPDRPLRGWRLVDVDPTSGLTAAPVRIDERILHHLAGLDGADERLAPHRHRLRLAVYGHAGDERLAADVAALVDPARGGVVELCGGDAERRRFVASSAAQRLGRGLVAIDVASLPADPELLAGIVRRIDREAILDGSVVLLVGDDESGRDVGRTRRLAGVLPALTSPVILLAAEHGATTDDRTIALYLPLPATSDWRAAWAALLPPGLGLSTGEIDRLAQQFHLGVGEIDAVARLAPSRAATGGDPTAATIWRSARDQARRSMGGLAERVEPSATWADLVLPPAPLGLLHDIARHVRHRTVVYETWGFERRTSRGLGITALLSGPSGTGKTMAAEVLASDLDLDLYRIDLSQVVSKYIGETEKNLRTVIDAAEGSGAILLFDEADALFGRRTEVRDSHDRYANIEVSYLLQRMEAYRGLAILTTNFRDAIDQAFVRRLRFIVELPVPDVAQRRAIWAGVFPTDAPVSELPLDRLAQLAVTGGTIRSIAMTAAFLAADAGEPIDMRHLWRATEVELAKSGRRLNGREQEVFAP